MTAEQPQYQRIANELRAAIRRGDYRPGDTIPKTTELQEQYGVARDTVRDAIAQLSAEGLVVPVRRRGTVVQEKPVTLSINRYPQVLRPGGQRGPFETACAEQGVDGRMDTVAVAHIAADADAAASLEIEPGTPVIYRVTHAIAAARLVQIQYAWLPLDLFADTPLVDQEKVQGGVYGAMTAAGHAPASFTESVTARLPTPEEASTLRIGNTVPVLTVERVTRDGDRRPIELRRVLAVASRTVLEYTDLPLKRRRAR